MARIVSALNIKMFVGRLTAVDVSEKFFGLHYMWGVKGALDSGDLFVALVIVELRVFVELESELGEHEYSDKADDWKELCKIMVTVQIRRQFIGTTYKNKHLGDVMLQSN